MPIVQSLGIFTQIKQNKIGKKSLWAFGQTLGSRTAQLLWHDIHPVFSLSHKKKKKKNLLGAPWQAPEATKEMKITWKISAQRYRQISLFLQFRHELLCNIPLLYFFVHMAPSISTLPAFQFWVKKHEYFVIPIICIFTLLPMHLTLTYILQI